MTGITSCTRDEIGNLISTKLLSGRISVEKLSPTHGYALFYGDRNTASGPLIKTEREKQRYPFSDEIGRYAWRNLLRTGTNGKRIDRPKFYYPSFVNENNILRIPKMTWNEQNAKYRILEHPRKDETVVWPVKDQDGRTIEKNWERGWERVSREAAGYRVQRNNDGSGTQEISIHFIQRMDVSSTSKTWWGDSKYASSASRSCSGMSDWSPTRIRWTALK